MKALRLSFIFAVALSAGCAEKSKPEGENAPAVADEPARRAVAPEKAFVPAEKWCAGRKECLESPFTAYSPAEVKWLRDTGFPTAEEFQAFKNAPDATLRKASDAGSLAAMALLGSRLAEQRDKEGFSLLQEAANKGSIFAYYEISRIYADHRGWADAMESAAFLRVAYLLGDRRAADVLHRSFPHFGPVELRLVDERAAALLRTFANGRKPRPRP